MTKAEELIEEFIEQFRPKYKPLFKGFKNTGLNFKKISTNVARKFKGNLRQFKTFVKSGMSFMSVEIEVPDGMEMQVADFAKSSLERFGFDAIRINKFPGMVFVSSAVSPFV